MAVTQSAVLTDDDLSETDRRALDVLADGRVTPQYLADELDVTRPYASKVLRRFREHTVVERIAPGLYELVSDPRENAESETQ